MDCWSKLQSSFGSVNFAQVGNKFSKGFNSSIHATRQRLGQIAADERTELPQGQWPLILQLKNTSQEQARLEVENAEDDLVHKTEVAITLMKTVLENPEPVKKLNELAKTQLLYFSAAAEALSSIQGEIEEPSVAAEGECKDCRG
ncbi:hypothetical protein K443DRAFT_6976 [Laccaria amethystina LaAM-08-1]|uniref:Uncharacterized protein n=1 Tax=Laccaria amethystina LaAM-08-1 TaxID=1095629 RepID=A0A0C9XUH2_9AGAR|nr:hypothetical protein K443DRAFT_6976 [Laccaria amethystina LaAM-08-1]